MGNGEEEGGGREEEGIERRREEEGKRRKEEGEGEGRWRKEVYGGGLEYKEDSERQWGNMEGGGGRVGVMMRG